MHRQGHTAPRLARVRAPWRALWQEGRYDLSLFISAWTAGSRSAAVGPAA